MRKIAFVYVAAWLGIATTIWATEVSAQESDDEAELGDVDLSGEASEEGDELDAILEEAVGDAQEPVEETDTAEDGQLDDSLSEAELQNFLLDVVTTTSTKSAKSLEEVPSMMTVFTREEIDRLGAKQLIDLLQYVPGFYEVGSQMGKNFAIRGIHSASAQHFVILMDGLPMNDFLTSTASPDSFSLDWVERVEIVRGPGSAIYGASALMGVVNIITKKGSDYPYWENKFSVGNDWYFRDSLVRGFDFGENGSLLIGGNFLISQGTTFQVSGSEDILIPEHHIRIDQGLTDGDTITLPRGSTPIYVNRYGPSFELFLKYQLDDDFMLRLNFARTDSYMQRTMRGSLVDAEEEIQEPRYVTHRAVLDLEKRFGRRDKYGQLTFRPAVTWHAHDMRSQRIGHEFWGHPQLQNNAGLDEPYYAIIQGWSGNDLRVMPMLEYAIDFPEKGIWKENSIVIGFQPEYNLAFDYSAQNCYLDSNNEHLSPSPYNSSQDLFCVEEFFIDEGTHLDFYGNETAPDSEENLGNGDEWRFGGFLQYSTNLADIVGAVVGARADYHPDFGFQLSPRAALVFQMPAGFYAKAQYSRAFIYPAFLYRTDNARALYGSDPDPTKSEIEPQWIDSVEMMLGMKKKALRLELNGYFNKVNNFITYDVQRYAQSGRYEFSNQGDLGIVGGEANAVVSLLKNRLSFHLNGALAFPVDKYTDDVFLVDGSLGGPTKYPEYMAGVIMNTSPWKRFNLSISFLHTAQVTSQTVTEATFISVTGTDGRQYTSLAQSDYDTRTFLLNASAYVDVHETLRLSVDGYNLLNRRHYRPGSLTNPILLDGLRITGNLTFRF